jgi:hypothetical protein
MDGVFCDFERGAQEHTGDLSSRDYPDDEFWPLIMKTPFFQTLHPMQNAMDLWNGVQAFLEKSGQRIPIFLTGCPKDPFRKAAEAGKEAWIRKHFLKEGGHIHTLSVPVEAGFDEDAVALSAAAEELLKKAGHNDIIMIFCRPDQKYFFDNFNWAVNKYFSDNFYGFFYYDFFDYFFRRLMKEFINFFFRVSAVALTASSSRVSVVFFVCSSAIC